ncbi:MAG: hypothetical protein ACFUZC_02705 [Chthoniobacteraceae bacterium]
MNRFLLSLVVLALALSTDGAWANKALIDNETKNGGFEQETLQPWFGASDFPGCSIETGAGIAKSGKQCCRVRLEARKSQRAVARLFTNLTNVDPSFGRCFTVKLDVAGVANCPAMAIGGELIFIDDKSVSKSASIQGWSGTSSTEWTQIELPMTGEAPTDWRGGKVQFRLVFYVDNGTPGNIHELLIDNVTLIQKEKP